MTKRTRTRDLRTEHIGTLVVTNCNGGSTSTPVPHGLYSGITETTTDVVTPNFHRRRLAGEIINNEFTSVKTEDSFSLQTWIYEHDNPNCVNVDKRLSADRIYGLANQTTAATYLPQNIVADHTVALASLRTITGTRASANIIPAEIQGLVDIAEWRKTFRLIRNPLSGVKTFIDQIKKSRRYLKKVKRNRNLTIGQFLSNEWLRYRYGFLPLVLSIEGGFKAVTAPRTSKRKTARASGSTGVFTEVNGQQNPYTDPAYKMFTTSYVEKESSVRAGILYEYEMSFYDKVGISYHEIPAAIWEVIPYSFVVDWFLNVEDLLRAVVPKQGVKKLASWTTVKTTTTRSTNVTSSWNGLANYHNVSSPGGQFSRVTVEKTRKPGITVGLDTRIPLIRFEKPRDWLHLLDLISLINSNLKYR